MSIVNHAKGKECKLIAPKNFKALKESNGIEVSIDIIFGISQSIETYHIVPSG
jgi:hypothetical protein